MSLLSFWAEKGTRLYPLWIGPNRSSVRRKVSPRGYSHLQLHHSGIKKIYILTQFNSASLHNHISNTYIFDTFSKGFV